MQKAQLVEDSGAKNAQIDIVEDRTLSKNQCLVETDDGIFDCSLSVELTELKRKLQLLAYGSKKE
jgi:flagellar assembly protein FliH